MSRTQKDKPYKHSNQYHDWETDRYAVEYTIVQTHATEYNPKSGRYERTELSKPIEHTGTRYLQAKTSRTKKRKTEDELEWRWMHTPSWFHRLFNNVPQRRRGRAWERKVMVEDLDETDPPRFSKRPEKYYW